MFKVYCPGQYNHFPHKLMMFNNGSMNTRYKDICVERFTVNLAYNNDLAIFEVENNSLVDLREKYGYFHGEYVGLYSYISDEDELLTTFISNYNLIVNWIDCNYTWGWFDYETGKWTGAVGKVTSYLICEGFIINL